jgi:ribose 5-phosphate isomerase B
MPHTIKKTIIIASDHAGFALKSYLIEALRAEGHTVEDVGAPFLDAHDDYPVYVVPAAMRVAEKPEKYSAIVIGKSGQGEAIVANRFPMVRAAVFYGGPRGHEILTLSREHNDANVLSIGAGFVSNEEARDAVKLWLSTPFSGEERHARRIELIDSIS